MNLTQKSKKIIGAILALLIVIIIMIVALSGGAVFKDGPEKTAEAIGNGGMAVTKGEYIYFVNGYEENTAKNKGNKIEHGAIYRVKAENTLYNKTLDASDNVTRLDISYGFLENDENGSTVGAKRLVSKIAGFENTQLWVFGNTLYFTSPSTSRTISGEKNYDFIDVFKINVNGKGLKKLYTIVNYSDGQVNFYKNGDDVYGIFYDGSDKFVIYKNGKRHTTKTGVSQLAMPTFDQDDKNMDNRSEQVLAYIQQDEEDSRISYIRTLQFPNADNTEFKEKSQSYMTGSPKLIGIKRNILYYEHDYYSETSLNTTGIYYVNTNDITKIFSIEINSRELTLGTYESYVVMTSKFGGNVIIPRILAYKSGEVTVITPGATPEPMVLEGGGTSILAADDQGFLIYYAGTSLWHMNYVNGECKKLTGDTNVLDYVVSYDGRCAYYFKQIEKEVENDDGSTETVKGIYLERVNTLVFVNEEEGYLKQELSWRLEKDWNEEDEE